MFLSPAEAADVRKRFGTPCYVYDRASLEAAAARALAFPHAFGLTVRYAMKANSCRAILTLFRDLDLRVDASSDFEVERALRAGFAPERIALTSQAPSRRLRGFVEGGIRFTACSLLQLERFGETFPGRDVTIRVNPGLGSGAANRVNTGGPGSSFGIWHEDLDEAKALAARHNVTIAGLHSHIGSGSDPAVWTRVARLSLEIATRLPEAIVVSLGGGFKVARMEGENGTDLAAVGAVVRDEFLGFQRRTGRSLHLEIEPGAYLVANAGAIVATCVDRVATGPEGYRFAKLDAGMTELLRPSLYGAQHPVTVIAGDGSAGAPQRPHAPVVFVGPCCETGDVLTPAPGDPEGLLPRESPIPEIGDLVIIGGAGAYGASMAATNYNSYPAAPEVMRTAPGEFRLVRRRQTLEQVVLNEVVED
ncbi:MAG TPA: diaminopimelate decarboxylase [Candidatus Eisenbacteria bacterium]|nr:diaminopimelate decarboxylase [Candidatus Eisenbacteria bacterium]